MDAEVPHDRLPRLTYEDAKSLLLKFMFSGGVGSAAGKVVSYSLVEQNNDSYVFLAALEELEETAQLTPVDRYRIAINSKSGKLDVPDLIFLSTPDLEHIIFRATGFLVSQAERFTSGALSISYKVSVHDNPLQFVVQMRHHGNVDSINTIMELVSSKVDRRVLPLPKVYPFEFGQRVKGMGIQVAEFIPGNMAGSVYSNMTHQERLVFAKNLALAFDAIWTFPLPKGFKIGELYATRDEQSIKLEVKPDRHYSLGGPFDSVAEYLRAHIRGALKATIAQEGIDEYKSRYLQRLTDFVESGMFGIPAFVEETPVVFVHSDLGLHNIIVSSSNPSEIVGIIDWEFCGSLPYPCLDYMIERLFRKSPVNGYGPEYDDADQLRDAFWDAIPSWTEWNKSEAVKVFREWHQFGKFMKPEPLGTGAQESERERVWEHHEKVVREFLVKWAPNKRSVAEYIY